jgi:SAM-dependent methyltransferase
MTESELFYKSQYDFYKSKYWNTNHNDLNIPNGFDKYPLKEYNYFSDLLNDYISLSKCNILDICCGNGLLLNHLINHCSFDVIPFGIDFQENSIKQAKDEIHTNFKDNFFIKNANSFDFSERIFDIVLLDPYHFTDEDLQNLTTRILGSAKTLAVFYCYQDVLANKNYATVADFPTINSLTLKIYDYAEISIGIYVTEKNGIQQGVLQYWGGRNNNEHL